MRTPMKRPDSLFESFLKEMNEDNYRLGKGIDIYKQENAYVVEIDMPGFNTEDIKVDFNDDVLMIQAKSEQANQENKEYYYKNRSTKAVMRKIRFSDVNQEEISGEYINGVLKLHLPTVLPETPKSKQIEIK